MKGIARSLPASGIRKFFDLATEIQAQGDEVLRMDVGRPVWSIDSKINVFLNTAMDQGQYHYIANRGNLLLRETLCDMIASRTGKKYNPETEIIITTGASEGLAMCALALLGTGDEMIIPEPAWPHYKAVAEMAGQPPVTVPLAAEDNFAIDIEKIKQKISDNTKILVVNTPGNPTGAVQSREVLTELADLAEKHGFFILSDEVYDNFLYDTHTHVSMCEIMGDSDRLIYLNSLSKSYSMTGWRIGYVCCAPDISDALNRIHQYLTVCGVATVQYAAAHFLTSERNNIFLEEMHDEFSRRRNVWAEEPCTHENFMYKEPAGAFYLFPKFSFNNMNSEKFCEWMLRENKICMVPGKVFGTDFDDHIRISFSGTVETQLKAKSLINGLF